MAIQFDGSSRFDSNSFASLFWLDLLAMIILLAQFIYLTISNTSLPVRMLFMLKIITLLAILLVVLVMVQFIDLAPPIFSWLMDWCFYVYSYVLAITALEIFKTFSSLGHYITTDSVVKAQYIHTVTYIVCVAGHYLTLITLGQPPYKWISDVYNINQVVVYWSRYLQCRNDKSRGFYQLVYSHQLAKV